jgi:hypothetical protein
MTRHLKENCDKFGLIEHFLTKITGKGPCTGISIPVKAGIAGRFSQNRADFGKCPQA